MPTVAVEIDENPGTCNKVCSLVCAYLLPPLGVWWRFRGDDECCCKFCICLILTCCGYIPGVIYAACVIGCDPQYQIKGVQVMH